MQGRPEESAPPPIHLPATMRYTAAQHDAFARDFNRDGLLVLKNHFPREKLAQWAQALQPLLDAQVEREKSGPSRGAQRYYVTLPFAGLFADAQVYEDRDILSIVERVAG